MVPFTRQVGYSARKEKLRILRSIFRSSLHSSVFPSDRRCRIRELFSNNSRRIRQNFRKRMYHGCVKMFRKRRTSVSLHRWCCVVDFYFSATLVKIRRDEFSTGNSGEILFAALVGTTSIPKLDSTRSGRVTLPIGSRWIRRIEFSFSRRPICGVGPAVFRIFQLEIERLPFL